MRIEVLHMVNGLSTKDLSRTMELRIAGMAARVLLPHLILKAKIRNSVSIPQEGRNDVKHVRMILLCVHAFIGEFAGYVGEDSLSERALINLLEETLEIVTSEHALRSSGLWSF